MRPKRRAYSTREAPVSGFGGLDIYRGLETDAETSGEERDIVELGTGVEKFPRVIGCALGVTDSGECLGVSHA